MSPVSPVFHTEESVRLSLNSKRTKDIQSRDKMSMLEQRAPIFVPTFMHMAQLILFVCLSAKSGHQRDFAPSTHPPK